MANKLILIAEDDKSIRMLLELRLKKEKFDTALFSDGAAALEYMTGGKSKPDLIITDVMMPKLNGYQFCKILKSDAVLKKIPVIMLTAKKEISSKLTGFTLGADEYIYKPFNITSVIESIRKLIDAVDKPQSKIRYGLNNTVLFKIANDIEGLKKIREIIIELTELYSLTLKTVEYIENLFSELTDLFLIDSEKKFFIKFAFTAQPSKKILMKMELEDEQIFLKNCDSISGTLKKYANKFFKINNGYLFEIWFETVDNIIGDINFELTETVNEVTDNIKQLKKIEGLWNT